jgi:CRISPR-associated endonuclease Cas1
MEKENTTYSNRKIPHWFPYTSEIQMSGKEKVNFVYNGGTCATKFARIHSILFYGSVCDLSQKFLEKCTQFRIPICIHRRNIGEATWILPSVGPRHNNALTKQIMYRNNDKKSAYIARRLLKAKFTAMSWLTSPLRFPKKWQTIDKMRQIEARHARKYWDKYYRRFDYKHSKRRENTNEISKALNAVSKYISGVVLRWVLYHRLSPYHGFLHLPSDYPSLVYDLMEPYRGYIEKRVFKAIKEAGEVSAAITIEATKELLDEEIYTDATRQIVTFHELLHGNVLALRAYLLGEANRFIVPIPGKPTGGRPKKTGYKLYGRSAGPTDFWKQAHKISENSTLASD